jgi:hypothetical protein
VPRCSVSLFNILDWYFSTAEVALFEEKNILDITPETVWDDLWFPHPNQEECPIEVNESGTHVCYNDNGKLKNIRIRRYQSKWAHWVNQCVTVNGKNWMFSRLALECFSGIMIGRQQCDHLNIDRDDNSTTNLASRGILFQANNKTWQKKHETMVCTAVYIVLQTAGARHE